MEVQPYPLWVTKTPKQEDLWALPLPEILDAFAHNTWRVVGWMGLNPVGVRHGCANVEGSLIADQDAPVFYAETRKDAVVYAFKYSCPAGHLRDLAEGSPGPGSSWIEALNQALAAPVVHSPRRSRYRT